MSAEIFYAMFQIVHVLKLKMFVGTRAPSFHPETSYPFLIASLYEFGARETHRVKSTTQACFCVMGLLQYVTKKAGLLVKSIQLSLRHRKGIIVCNSPLCVWWWFQMNNTVHAYKNGCYLYSIKSIK